MLARVEKAARFARIARVALIALIAPAACWIGPDAPASPRAPRPTGVRAVDWQNRTYRLDDYGAVKVRNGRGEFPLLMDDDGRLVEPGRGRGTLSVEPALFTDVDNNGDEEAVVLSVISAGGTTRISQVQIFTVQQERIVPLATIVGGDRADGGIRSVAVDHGAVVIIRNLRSPGEPLCCASSTRRERWVWQYGEMVEEEGDDHRDEDWE